MTGISWLGNCSFYLKLKIEWVKNIENCLNWGSFCTFSEDETLIMSGLRALDYEVNIRIYFSLIAWQLPTKFLNSGRINPCSYEKKC